MREVILALIRPVITSTEGRWVETMEMNAGRPGHLGQPDNGTLHFMAVGSHQVRQFVYHDYEIWQRFLPVIVASNVARSPRPTGELVAPIHFPD